ncbi:DUF4349 domain-containing protein [Corynebacterium nasicanis]|uniref:DUF4349 domain-containing protein n=1 Tax=Corynebacterium nasicanis TaxID=1448267 RepID=A0ABW1Q9J6_9CORY
MNALRTLLLTAVLAMFLSACGTDSWNDVEIYPEDRAVEHAVPAVPAEPAGLGEGGASISSDVITTGTASVRTGEPESAAADLAADVRAAGGRVEFSETSTRGEQPRAEVTVRLPAEKYESFVGTLGEYGEVIAQSTQAADVTQQRVDLQARQAALQASIDRLTELMTGAANVDDLLRAEEMLTQRQADLDALTAQLEQLQDQVGMSTLSVTFTVDDDGYQPPGVFERMWQAFVSSLETMVIVLVGLLPWLVVLGLLAAVVSAVIRRRRARRSVVVEERD